MSSSIKKYYSAFYTSQNLLCKLSKINFPVDIFSLLNNLMFDGMPILVSTKTDFLQWKNTFFKIGKPPKINDARCYYDQNRNLYLIVYNEAKPPNRIRFSLAHELAHIVLHHLNDKRTELARGGLDDFTYWRMEGEANTFAGTFLAPPVLINERFKDLLVDKVATIQSSFLISEDAAKHRLSDYIDWAKFKVKRAEKQILKRYGLQMHPRYCSRCNYLFYSTNARYCPICGNGRLSKKWRKDYMIYNDGAETDENNRVLKCARCENEEIGNDNKFCKICGSTVVNECADMEIQDSLDDFHVEKGCGKVLDSNARYCPYCGNESTFLQAGVLKPWEEAKKEIEAREQAAVTDSSNVEDSSENDEPEFVEIGDDEVLPF